MRAPAPGAGASASGTVADIQGPTLLRPRAPSPGCRALPPPAAAEEDRPLPVSPHRRGGAPRRPGPGASLPTPATRPQQRVRARVRPWSRSSLEQIPIRPVDRSKQA